MYELRIVNPISSEDFSNDGEDSDTTLAAEPPLGNGKQTGKKTAGSVRAETPSSRAPGSDVEKGSVEAAASSGQSRYWERDLEEYRMPGCSTERYSDSQIRFLTGAFVAFVIFAVVYSMAATNGDGFQENLQPGRMYHGEPGIGGCDDTAVCCHCE